MCDKFDMLFCFEHCLKGDDNIKYYTGTQLCIEREKDSCNYCYFSLDIKYDTRECSEWKKLIGNYLFSCLSPMKGSSEAKKNLMEFMNEHVEFTDGMDNELRKKCPYYTEVLMSQYNKKTIV